MPLISLEIIFFGDYCHWFRLFYYCSLFLDFLCSLCCLSVTGTIWMCLATWHFTRSSMAATHPTVVCCSHGDPTKKHHHAQTYGLYYMDRIILSRYVCLLVLFVRVLVYLESMNHRSLLRILKTLSLTMPGVMDTLFPSPHRITPVNRLLSLEVGLLD